jgi:hypothetical protein
MSGKTKHTHYLCLGTWKLQRKNNLIVKLSKEFQKDKQLQKDQMHHGCIAVIEEGSGS